MTKPLAVLIVEDMESDVQLIVRLLDKAGYQVDYLHVDTAEGMRAALQKQPWDIVISDYSMPQFDGSAALALLQEEGLDIPFIMVSGTMGEETAVAMMKAGAHDYLMKGNLARLVPAIERELEQAGIRRERQQSRNDLRASEKRFRALIENSTDAISLLDASGNAIYDSPSAPGMLGYGPEDWIGKNAFELMHPDDLPKIADMYQKLTQTPGAHVDADFRAKHKDGSWLWIEATATNMLEEPSVKAIVLNYRDVTRRKQAEEALQISEERFYGAFEYAAIGMALVSPEGHILRANHALCELLDYSNEELLEKAFQDITHPEDLEADVAYFRQLIDGEIQSYKMEKRYFKRSGQIVWTSLTVSFIRDDRGEPLYAIAQIENISERKKAEEALRTSETRYKALFEDSPVALWEEDFSAVKKRLAAVREDGITNFDEYFKFHPELVAECAALVKVVDVNKAAINMLGANEKEDLFKGLVNLLQGEPNQEFQNELINISKGKTEFGWEGDKKTLDGRLININLNWSAAPGYEESLLKVIVSVIDITDRKKAEAALRESEARFRGLFEDSPISLWEEDLSAVKGRLDALRDEGITDFREYFTLHPEAITEHVALIKILNVNKATLSLMGATQKEEILKSLTEIFGGMPPDVFRDELINMAAGNARFSWEGINRTLDGRLINIAFSWSVAPGYESTLSKVIVSMIDITERKKAEVALRESEARYKGLFEDSPIALWEEDFSAVKQRLDELGKEGIKIFREYFRLHPEVVEECAALVKVVDVNSAAIKLLGAEGKDDLIKGFAGILKDEPDHAFQQELNNIAAGKTRFGNEAVNKTLDGRLINVDMNWSAAPGFEDSLSKVIISLIDITERKRAEAELQRSEEHFRLLVEGVKDYAIFMLDATGHIVSWNSGAEHIKGYRAEEIIGEHFSRFYTDDDRKNGKPEHELEIASRTGHYHEEGIRMRKDGSQFMADVAINALRDESGELLGFAKLTRDITELKQTELALARSEQEYRTLFENMPIGLYRTAADGRILEANSVMVKMFGYHDRESLLAENVTELYVDPASDEKFKSEIKKNDIVSNFEAEFKREDGTTFWTEDHIRVIRDGDGNSLYYEGSLIDITERKLAEEGLTAERDLLNTLVNTLSDSIFIKDVTGRILMDNDAHRRTLGADTLEQVVGKTDFDFHSREQAAQFDAEEKQVIQSGEPLLEKETPLTYKDNRQGWFLTTKVPLRDRAGNITGIVGFNHDITERKQAEEVLTTERNLLRTLIDNLPDVVYAKDVESRFILKNIVDARRMGAASVEETIGKTDFDYYPPEIAAQYHADDQTVIKSGQAIINREETIVDAAGRAGWISTTKVPLRDSQGKLIGLVGIGHDITERKQSEERIQRQLGHLVALRAIDQVIISSFDLRTSLTVILTQVTKELGVDAADVLTLSSGYQSLEYTAGVGFRTRAAEKAKLRLGESYAGRVALERKLVQVADLKDQPEDVVLKTALGAEGFVCYYGVPLIAKGSVKGVLEVYNRTPLEPDGEWLEFLNTLADQAALAIDNTSLFENLQRSNIDLTLAYDATIQGWSHAMDLRDKETEGHSLRVTEMTLELAALFGFKDEDMLGIRRGALLHDIGKMGVPDTILLKPSKLTDEEWVIMKKHPALAFDMLSPIHYLQSAMDIPYCHHEKWDGSGYPRGLKGEQIPLSARIFAIADVWDAVTSARPYREAWSKEKAIEYIASEAGKQFDPQVVKVCLDAKVFDSKKQINF